MNHKQINDLKVGDRLQLIEDYIYRMGDVGKAYVITKGSIMQFINPSLGLWRFEFEVMRITILPLRMSFGRSRLLKLKVRKLEEQTHES